MLPANARHSTLPFRRRSANLYVPLPYDVLDLSIRSVSLSSMPEAKRRSRAAKLLRYWCRKSISGDLCANNFNVLAKKRRSADNQSIKTLIVIIAKILTPWRINLSFPGRTLENQFYWVRTNTYYWGYAAKIIVICRNNSRHVGYILGNSSVDTSPTTSVTRVIL